MHIQRYTLKVNKKNDLLLIGMERGINDVRYEFFQTTNKKHLVKQWQYYFLSKKCLFH